MFTGLISHTSDLVRVDATAAGRALTVASPWDDLADGESIACNGVCLTVASHAKDAFTVSAVGTTLDKTTIGEWAAGRRINLERALRVGDRLGGHMVQGHVDGIGLVTDVRTDRDALLIEIALWEGADGLCVPQGSVTIDGVSLTVYSLNSPLTVGVSIIDYTRRHTSLGAIHTNDKVNVELDVIGKYVRQQLNPWAEIKVHN